MAHHCGVGRQRSDGQACNPAGCKAETISVTIGALTPEKIDLASAPAKTSEDSVAPLGLTVQALNADLAQGLSLPADATGLVIDKVEPSSANADRLLPGDVITEAAGKPVASAEALRTAVAGATSKSAVLLKVMRDGKPLFVGASIATM